MDAGPLNTIVLGLIVAALFFYVLYGVVRAAVHDGIRQAEAQRDDQPSDPLGNSAK